MFLDDTANAKLDLPVCISQFFKSIFDLLADFGVLFIEPNQRVMNSNAAKCYALKRTDPAVTPTFRLAWTSSPLSPDQGAFVEQYGRAFEDL